MVNITEHIFSPLWWVFTVIEHKVSSICHFINNREISLFYGIIILQVTCVTPITRSWWWRGWGSAWPEWTLGQHTPPSCMDSWARPCQPVSLPKDSLLMSSLLETTTSTSAVSHSERKSGERETREGWGGRDRQPDVRQRCGKQGKGGTGGTVKEWKRETGREGELERQGKMWREMWEWDIERGGDREG